MLSESLCYIRHNARGWEQSKNKMDKISVNLYSDGKYICRVNSATLDLHFIVSLYVQGLGARIGIFYFLHSLYKGFI